MMADNSICLTRTGKETLWDWSEGHFPAPTKTKVSPRGRLPVTQHEKFINLHLISACEWDTQSDEKDLHTVQEQTHTHTLTHVHDLMRDQRNQRERKQSNIWPLSQTLRCERRRYNFINILTEVHQCGHQAVIYTRICSDHLTTMALRLQVHHRRRWSDFRVYPLTLLQWCIGHGS